MLKIEISATEFFDDNTNTFFTIAGKTLCLEHSLVSLKKWESKWKKPFMHSDNITEEEMLDYIKCMTISQNVDPLTYMLLTEEHYKQISDYINDPMTATWFSDKSKSKRNGRIVTAELLYCWMFNLNIPLECQKWHLNQLITLIRVCNEENAPKKKMSKRDVAARNMSLNAARRKAMGTKG